MNEPWSYGPCYVAGETASKANSRQLVHYGGHPAFIKSAKARTWMDLFALQVKRPKEAYTGDVCLEAVICYGSRRPDLDEALLMDAIQKVGILANDRQIKRKEIEWSLKPGGPYVEFRLTPWVARLNLRLDSRG